VAQQLRSLIPDPSTRGFVLQNVVRSVHAETSLNNEGVDSSDKDSKDNKGNSYKPPQFGWRLNLPVLVSNLRSFSRFSPSVSVPFTQPTLFVKGSNSDFITEQHYPSMKRYFPNYELVTIENSNHWVHADQPVEFVKAVAKFLHKHKL